MSFFARVDGWQMVGDGWTNDGCKRGINDGCKNGQIGYIELPSSRVRLGEMEFGAIVWRSR